MESTGLSASDVALLNRDRYDGDGFGFGGNGIWIIAILFLMMMFGCNRGCDVQAATASEVRDGFDFAALERQNNEIVSEVKTAVDEINNSIKDGNYNLLGEIRDVQSAVNDGFYRAQEKSCEILRSIDGVNYKGALNKAEIIEAVHAEAEATRNMYQQNRMSDMQNRINQLEMDRALCGVVRYPNQWVYSAGNAPFCNNGNYCCGQL